MSRLAPTGARSHLEPGFTPLQPARRARSDVPSPRHSTNHATSLKAISPLEKRRARLFPLKGVHLASAACRSTCPNLCSAQLSDLGSMQL